MGRGAKGVGFGEGVSPFPNRGKVWRGGCAPFPENVLTFWLKIVHAFWRLF